jgi:hypothetical protein
MAKKLTLKKGNRVIAIKDSPEGLYKAGDTGYIADNDEFPGAVAVHFENSKWPKIYTRSDKAADYLQDFPTNDVIRKEIIGLVDKQFAKGVAKYGAALSENPKNLSVIDMLDYLAEELVDALHYNRKLKEMLITTKNNGIEFSLEEKDFITRLAKKVEANGSR